MKGRSRGETAAPPTWGFFWTWCPKWVGGCRFTANTAVFKLRSARTTLGGDVSLLPCEN